MTLPDAIVPGHKTHSHYSLKDKLREQQPLRDQVAALKRDGHMPLCSSTGQGASWQGCHLVPQWRLLPKLGF